MAVLPKQVAQFQSLDQGCRYALECLSLSAGLRLGVKSVGGHPHAAIALIQTKTGNVREWRVADACVANFPSASIARFFVSWGGWKPPRKGVAMTTDASSALHITNAFVSFPALSPQLARVACDCGVALLMEGAQGREARAALRMLARAHEAGVAEATYAIGLCLIHGVGIERDEERGSILVRRAANAGHAPAMAFLAERDEAAWREHGDRKALRRALACLQALADAGDAAAKARLGGLLLEVGARRDEAYDLLESASRAGDAKATRLLGLALREGTGPVYDPARGDALIRRAALMGDEQAARLLAA